MQSIILRIGEKICKTKVEIVIDVVMIIVIVGPILVDILEIIR